jgi:hypothetical protein
MQLAEARADVALDAPVLKSVPMTGGKTFDGRVRDHDPEMGCRRAAVNVDVAQMFRLGAL